MSALMEAARNHAEALRRDFSCELRLEWDTDENRWFAHDDSRQGCWFSDLNPVDTLKGLREMVKLYDEQPEIRRTPLRVAGTAEPMLADGKETSQS